MNKQAETAVPSKSSALKIFLFILNLILHLFLLVFLFTFLFVFVESPENLIVFGIPFCIVLILLQYSFVQSFFLPRLPDRYFWLSSEFLLGVAALILVGWYLVLVGRDRYVMVYFPKDLHGSPVGQGSYQYTLPVQFILFLQALVTEGLLVRFVTRTFKENRGRIPRFTAVILLLVLIFFILTAIMRPSGIWYG